MTPFPRHSSLGHLGQAPLAEVLGTVGRATVRRVVFRSAISPDVELDPRQAGPRSAAQGGFQETFLRFAKPAMYVETPAGVVTVAPWGEPRMNWFPVLAVGTGLGILALVGLAARGMRKRRG